MKDGDLELPGMSRAGRAEQFVRRRYAGATLQALLQLAFRVFDHGTAVWVGQFIGKDAVDKVICSVQPAVEIQRGDQRLKGILQCGLLTPFKFRALAVTQDEVLLEAKRGGLGGQRRAVDQSGAGLGQVAFILVGMRR